MAGQVELTPFSHRLPKQVHPEQARGGRRHRPAEEDPNVGTIPGAIVALIASAAEEPLADYFLVGPPANGPKTEVVVDADGELVELVPLSKADYEAVRRGLAWGEVDEELDNSGLAV
jgi:hypothetical protein